SREKNTIHGNSFRQNRKNSNPAPTVARSFVSKLPRRWLSIVLRALAGLRVVVRLFTAFRLWRFLAVFRFVLGCELGFLLRMAREALRVRTIVLLTPVSLGFEIGDQLHLAQGANIFGNAVFVAPPAAMRVLARGVRRGVGLRCLGLGTTNQTAYDH